jgi:hypothetical protein
MSLINQVVPQRYLPVDLNNRVGDLEVTGFLRLVDEATNRSYTFSIAPASGASGALIIQTDVGGGTTEWSLDRTTGNITHT